MKKILYLLALAAGTVGCDRLDEDRVDPIDANDFPQQVILKDEGDGDLENADEMSFTITLADRIDPDGEAPRGRVVPLVEDVTVAFRVSDPAGFTDLGDYLLGWSAQYEIDDCTTSEDQGIDLGLSFDPATGIGSVRFPAGVEEVDVTFELDAALFDDGALNDEARGFVVTLTDLTAAGADVVINTDLTFTYEVLDDEAIFGAWTLDPLDAAQWAQFQQLFGLISPDVAALSLAEVNDVSLEINFDKVTFALELVAEETVTECGETETDNVKIELEGGQEELPRDATEGDIEFADDLATTDGPVEEFKYAGEFSVQNGTLTLTLAGEFDGDETEETTLIFVR